MTCDFKPGDEVVCVDARVYRSLNGWAPGCAPVEGCQYTVIGTYLARDDTPCVHLKELRNVTYGGPSGGYAASRFRKVQKRDLGTWLAQTTGYDEEHHSPAPTKKTRERA